MRYETTPDATVADLAACQHGVVNLRQLADAGTRAAFERDRERDAALTAAGWRVVRVTHRRLATRPFEVAALVARLLSARSPWPSTP
jgi:very-short-patch-repair endonuclease